MDSIYLFCIARSLNIIFFNELLMYLPVSIADLPIKECFKIEEKKEIVNKYI